jgi:hypothetical protein
MVVARARSSQYWPLVLPIRMPAPLRSIGRVRLPAVSVPQAERD